MGGNALVINKHGAKAKAEKIQIDKIGRDDFVETFKSFFKKLNEDFKNVYGESIWNNQLLEDGSLFSGSTSFIMNESISSDEVMKYKPSAGDIDIMVPERFTDKLWEYLNTIEGEAVIQNMIYIGAKRNDQINSVVESTFDDYVCNVQVDFEFLPFIVESGLEKPSEWARFSHSASFMDIKEGIKAVHHKYLIRSLVYCSSLLEGVTIATAKSTPEKLTISKSKTNQNPRMLKFSIQKGIREAYSPMLDDGNEMFIEGKQVFKEIPTKDSHYITEVNEMCNIAFNQVIKTPELFESFVGVIQLMKEHLTHKQIEDTHNRFLNLLWGSGRDRAQELEANNPDLDFEIKEAGYQYFIKELELDDISESLITEFYKSYDKQYGQFRTYLESLHQTK